MKRATFPSFLISIAILFLTTNTSFAQATQTDSLLTIDNERPPQRESPLEQLWNWLGTTNSGFTRSYEEFYEDMLNENARRRLHKNLQGLYPGHATSFEEFTMDILEIDPTEFAMFLQLDASEIRDLRQRWEYLRRSNASFRMPFEEFAVDMQDNRKRQQVDNWIRTFQKFADRITIDEISFITQCKMVFFPGKIDSVLRSKHFKSEVMNNNDVIYKNDYKDLYYSHYNQQTDLLMVLLTLKDYEYYSYLRSDLMSRFKKIKSGPFSNFDLAEFYDGPLSTFIAATDTKKNDYAIITITKIGAGTKTKGD